MSTHIHVVRCNGFVYHSLNTYHSKTN